MSTIDDLLQRLRIAGGDTTEIEVNSCAGGLAQSILPSLCSLANLPGGGWLILGLDENAGFKPVQLGDLQALKQGVAGKARACTPPVVVSFEDAQVEGLPVILARVAECTPSLNPCRVTSTGVAWARWWDGDYTMSSQEETAFLAQRTQPGFDREPVERATIDDLDTHLVEVWSETVATLDPHGLGRFTGREQLFRGGVITNQDVPTKAGLPALGIHPQQFFPRYVINLAAVTASGTDSGVRAQEVTTLSGPIPTMLDSAMEWARRVFVRTVVDTGDGGVRDSWTYPLEAFRELVGNALVHRDLDEWSEGIAIEVRVTDDKLVVISPGGLYGISLDRLGNEGTTSARNARLVEVCKYTRTSADERVVETLASGMPKVFSSLKVNGNPPPVFSDNGLRFTAALRPRRSSSQSVGTPPKSRPRPSIPRA